MDQGVVGVMCEMSEGLIVLNMPVCFRIGTGVESCKPCQGIVLRRGHRHGGAGGEF
jgi:hypothetical protein